MDLHSYAKRRSAKKWTLEQKRKLVDARISYDPMFANHPALSLTPWKKFISMAKLDDYNAFFVRKQWYTMVAKYKQHKQNRLGNMPTKAIDNEMLSRMTAEWEFFEPIHHFMTSKTTNLHSYALKKPNENELDNHATRKSSPCPSVSAQRQSVGSGSSPMSSTERINALCSSDTNEDFIAPMSIHASEDTQESNALNKIEDKFGDMDDAAVELQLPAYVREEVAETTNATSPTVLAHNDNHNSMLEHIKMEYEDSTVEIEMQNTNIIEQQEIIPKQLPTNSRENIKKRTRNRPNVAKKPNTKRTKTSSAAATAPTASHLKRTAEPTAQVNKERDAYYRHKRRFNHRIEKRLDALFNIFGQIVKKEYPNVDVNALNAMAGAAIASSDEE